MINSKLNVVADHIFSNFLWELLLMNKNDNMPLLIRDNSFENITKYTETFSKRNILDLKVPLKYYYILGDNAGNSEDSRSFGPIEQSEILYKIVN